jgi:hypothetical protein
MFFTSLPVRLARYACWRIANYRNSSMPAETGIKADDLENLISPICLDQRAALSVYPCGRFRKIAITRLQNAIHRPTRGITRRVLNSTRD